MKIRYKLFDYKIEYYDNGNIYKFYTLNRNNKKNGIYKMYLYNGKLERELYYKNGINKIIEYVGISGLNKIDWPLGEKYRNNFQIKSII
jgi:antitoxin component YwqK of YwqJK toxin-antitoxin module